MSLGLLVVSWVIATVAPATRVSSRSFLVGSQMGQRARSPRFRRRPGPRSEAVMVRPASSVVERLLCRQRVAGSMPAPGSISILIHRGFPDPVGQQQDSCEHGRAYQNPDHGFRPPLLPPQGRSLSALPSARGRKSRHHCTTSPTSSRRRNCGQPVRGTCPAGRSFIRRHARWG